jgi:hypothetical protein
MYNQIASAVYGTHYYDLQYVSVKNDIVNVEPIGWPQIDSPQSYASNIYINPSNEPCILISQWSIDGTGLWSRKRLDKYVWVTEKLVDGLLPIEVSNLDVREAFNNAAGYLVIGASVSGQFGNGQLFYASIIDIANGVCSYLPVRDLGDNDTNPDFFYSPWGISVYSANKPKVDGSRDWGAYHDLIESDGSIISERPLQLNQGDTQSYVNIQEIILGGDNQLYADLNIKGGHFPGAIVNLLARRVDPRGAP